MKTKNSIKNDFTLMAILLIPVGIAINIIGGQLAVVFKLPVYLDAIGTIMVSILAGPWVGALTGFLSNCINAIFDPVFLPYALVSIAIGLIAGFMARISFFATVGKTIVSGILIALTAAIMSAPITAYMFGGVTGSGSTFITGVLLATGQTLFQSVFTTSIISDTADKLISVFVCYFIIRSMSERYLSKFSLGLLNVPAKSGGNSR